MKKMEARCWATWVMIGFGLLLSALAFYVPEMNAHAGLGTSPSAPVCKPGAVCKPTGALMVMAPVATPEPAAMPAPAPTESGLGTSPSDPAAPATTQWYATAAAILIGLIGLAKKNERVAKFFATDGAGMASSFAVSAVFVFAEALSRGEAPSWTLAKHAVGLTIAMFAGYAGLLKRVVLPLARQVVTKVLGLPVPGWLAK